MSTDTITPDMTTAKIGDQIKAPFCVTKKVPGVTSTNKAMLSVEIVNDLGQRIAFKVWEEGIPMWDGIDGGDAVLITGRVKRGYARDPNVTPPHEIDVHAIEKLPTPHPVQRFLNPQFEGDAEALVARFEALKAQIRHPGYRRFIERFFEDACPFERFRTCPAAKGKHHAFLHGLLLHTCEVAENALHAADQALTRDIVPRDLVLVGALIHDAGKLTEYEWEGRPFGVAPRGMLYNHMISGPLMVQKTMLTYGEELAALGFTWEDADWLIHIQASHHGKPEWGANVEPCMLAAEVVHQADMMSARVRARVEEMQHATPGRDGVVQGTGYPKRDFIVVPLARFQDPAVVTPVVTPPPAPEAPAATTTSPAATLTPATSTSAKSTSRKGAAAPPIAAATPTDSQERLTQALEATMRTDAAPQEPDGLAAAEELIAGMPNLFQPDPRPRTRRAPTTR